MCEYCDLSKYKESYCWNDELYDLLVDLNDNPKKLYWTSLVMAYSTKMKQFYLVAIGDDEMVKKIDYCPMCGRELKHNEHV